MHLLDEVTEHLLGHIEVGDDAVLERTYRDDMRRRAADHPLGFGPHREDCAGLCVDGHDRRLVEHDPTTAHVYERVRRAQVYGHVATDELEHALHLTAP
jgi:hypothetical protein